MITMENDVWSGPKLVPFASRFGDIDVTISPDGSKILFCSKRPIPGDDKPKEDTDFWMAKRVGDTWGDPIYLGVEINSDRDDYYPVMTNNGTLYFSSQREGPGTNNIYRSELVDGKYTKAEKLGNAINTEHREFDPYISADETILIFSSNRPEGFGADDLYISYKNDDGIWIQAKNMGSKINTSGSEYCPVISPEGKYFFFTGARRESRRVPDRPLTYKDFEIFHNSPKNRFSDIYWMDAGIIEMLK
jgi:Tol biopolymer transport system component